MDGKQSAAWFKVLALCGALGLGGGYVWVSQQNAAKKRAEDREEQGRTVLPGSKSKVIVDEPQPFDGTLPSFDEVKDATTPADPRTNADFISGKGESRTVLPGSKSALVLPPAADDKEPERRTVLPGSKSIDRILQPPATEKEEP